MTTAMRGIARQLALVLLFCSTVFLVVALLATFGNRRFSYYSVDPADTLGASPLVGLMSHTGVLLAWGAAVVCGFAGLLVVRARGRRDAAPLVLLAVGVAYVAVDDLYMFHERIYPDFLGIPQKLVLLAYAVLGAAFFWIYRDFFRRQELPLLLLGVGLLAASVAIDVEARDLLVYETLKRWSEDGVKLFGLGVFVLYLLRLSFRMVADAYPDAGPRDLLGPDTRAAPVAALGASGEAQDGTPGSPRTAADVD